MKRTGQKPCSVIEVDLSGLPDVLWALRREMAQLLRQEAETEVSSYVRDRLNEIAAAFEVGVADG